MGREARCAARFGERAAHGHALLETDALLFRGDDGLRRSIPLAGIARVEARDGWMTVAFGDQEAAFHLGAAAPRWAEAILHPPELLDKLGVAAGARVAVAGLEDADFLARLRTRAVEVGAPEGGGWDVVILGVAEPAGLAALAAAAEAMRRSGTVWVVTAKGRRAPVPEAAVLAAGRAAGLVDVKVARFSATHTARGLVIPAARR